MRLLGPNSLGLLARQGLNASFHRYRLRKDVSPLFRNRRRFPTPFRLGATAQPRVSWFIALGDSRILMSTTCWIFLHAMAKPAPFCLPEHLSDARRFVSASRSAARNKPILVIKSGRSHQAQAMIGTASGLDAAGMPPFSAPVCCACRTRMSCFPPWNRSAICARCAVSA